MTTLFEQLRAALSDTYRVETELGGGGMSRVFLAEELELGRQVVIKVLPPDTAAAVNRERFQREIKLAASLQHPHIVPLLTTGIAGTDESRVLYYVMPYIEGESLRARLNRDGELPIGEAARVLREVVDALSYAHTHNVVHRDIKPDNVLMTAGHAVVTDFGVAKAVSASSGTKSSLTSLGVALGTPAYMSPEQASGDPHVDHRADIYAVGALAYELFTGRPPFTGSTPQQVLAAHVTQAPEPITSHRESIPADMANLVMRCLAKRPADRWQTAAELKVQLEAMTTPSSGGITPTGTQPVGTVSTSGMAPAFTAWRSLVDTPVKVAALFGAGAAIVMVLVYGAMIALGLPDWVFVGAIALLAIGAPIVLVTGRREQRRAEAATTGLHVTTPMGLERHMTWRKSLLGGGLAFAGLATVAGGFMTTRALGVGPGATLVSSGVLGARERIVLAEFANRTSDSMIGPSLTQALRIDLGQSPVVRLVETSELTPALVRMGRAPDEPMVFVLAQELAVREGFKAVVDGEVSELGDGFVLTARVVATTTGETLIPVRETAKGRGDLIDAVDRLSAKLRERIGESLKTIRASDPLFRVSTPSLEALQLYTRAEQADDAGDNDRALRLLQETVAVDSTFAMAYRKMSVVLSNMFASQTDQNAAATKAFELRDRLPPLERHLTAAYYHSEVTRDRDREVEAYRSALEVDPDSPAALNNLALELNARRQWREAEEVLRHGLEVAPIWQMHNALAAALSAQGNEAAVDSALEAFDAWSPGHVRAAWRRGMVQLNRRNYHSALATNREIREQNGSSLNWDRLTSFAFVFTYEEQGRFDDLRRVAGAMRDREKSLGNAGNALSWALWPLRMSPTVNRPETAQAEIARVLESHPLDEIPGVDRPWESLITLHAQSQQPSVARRLLTQWDEAGIAQVPGPRLMAQGEVEVAEGNYDDAIDTFRRYYREVGCNACGLFQLARAYDLAGQSDSALAVYERAVTIPDANRIVQTSRYLGPTFQRLGELHEARNDREKALHYYNELVDLWARADESLQPVVIDVRNRIARLVGEGR